MAIAYFSNFPFALFDVTGTNEWIAVPNIVERTRIIQTLFNDIMIFYSYPVKDGETPSIVAHRYYGSTQYEWLVLLANNILDPVNDWVKSYNDFQATLLKKYSTPKRDGVEYVETTIHHYEDSLGNVIDYHSWLHLVANERKAVTIYDWEWQQNEAKRNIRLVDVQYKEQITQQLEDILNNNPLR